MEHLQDPQSSQEVGHALSRVDTVSLAPPCRVWIRPSWPLMAMGALVMADADPDAHRPAVRDVPGWSTLRALLLHGVALRDRLARLPAAAVDAARSPAHLVDLIRDQGDAWWSALLTEAADTGWQHRGRDGSVPLTAAELDLSAAWERAETWQQRAAVQAQRWSADADRAAALAANPEQALRVLQAVLERVGQFVDRQAPRLARPERRTYVDAHQAFVSLVGRPLDRREGADSVRDVTAIPTPGLGDAVPVARHGTRWTVWIPQVPPEPPRDPLRVPRVLAALGDDLNQQLVELLAREGPSYAQKLAGALNAHASTLSRHLADLADAGLVRVRPEGHRIWHEVNPEALMAIEEWVQELHPATGRGARP